MKKKSLSETVLEYEPKLVTFGSPEDKLLRLRRKAMGYLKQYIWIMIIYGFWGLVYSYIYLKGGYPSLIISMGLSLMYVVGSGLQSLKKKV